MQGVYITKVGHAHCRIGSLESKWNSLIRIADAHCRIGSLEIHLSIIDL